jgi:hypothetical protein
MKAEAALGQARDGTRNSLASEALVTSALNVTNPDEPASALPVR